MEKDKILEKGSIAVKGQTIIIIINYKYDLQIYKITK